MQSYTVLYLSALICIEWCHSTLTRDPPNISSSFCMVQRSVWLSRVDESFPALPGSFAADKFVFLKVSINSAWGPFFESNGRNTPPTYFSFTSVKNTADVPIRCLKDLLRLAAHIDHKRIWRPLVIQDRKLQVKNLLRSRVAQEKRKRQKVTASVQTH